MLDLYHLYQGGLGTGWIGSRGSLDQGCSSENKLIFKEGCTFDKIMFEDEAEILEHVFLLDHVFLYLHATGL